jgi:hypothetical protein
MIIITTARDLETYVQNSHPERVQWGQQNAMVEALRSRVHPVWGSDWTPWFNDVIPEVLAELDKLSRPVLIGTEPSICPDCYVDIGELHARGCDVERCAKCGGQYISCACNGVCGRLPWTGIWPGTQECIEFGWFSRWDREAGEWIRCEPGDERGGPDLNRLQTEARWDAYLKRWMR